MSSKRYDTNPEKEEILEGLEYFTSEENPDLVNPKEIKELMDKLELKDKMSLIYNLISELCSDRKIIRNGGISKSDFISFIESKMSDTQSKPGIHTIYTVFSNSNEEPIPMTNFCKTARDIGDTEKDEELKELMKSADMYGKEMDFDEFYEMMTEDDKKKSSNPKKEKKYQKHNITKKYLWKKEEKDSEPQENKQNEKVYINNSSVTKEEDLPKNTYSHTRRFKNEKKSPEVEQISIKIEEKHEEKIEDTTPPAEEKKITLQEIITEKKVEVPKDNNNTDNNMTNVRYRYKFRNRFRRESNQENNINNNIEKKEENNDNKDNNNVVEENNTENNIENSESKRYHRRYRPNTNINNEGQTENNNKMYSRYRRKAEN